MEVEALLDVYLSVNILVGNQAREEDAELTTTLETSFYMPAIPCVGAHVSTSSTVVEGDTRWGRCQELASRISIPVGSFRISKIQSNIDTLKVHLFASVYFRSSNEAAAAAELLVEFDDFVVV
jgi:hypothetical protein